MDDDRWSNERLMGEAEALVAGRYGVGALFKIFRNMRDDLRAERDELNAMLESCVAINIPALEAEVERLRAELRKWQPLLNADIIAEWKGDNDANSRD